MTSLLQHSGRISKPGVELEGYLTDDGTWNSDTVEFVDCDVEDCRWDEHPQLYRFWRKPRGLFGHWVVFHINGEEKIPDLSHPMTLARVPRGARRLSAAENSEAWHE